MFKLELKQVTRKRVVKSGNGFKEIEVLKGVDLSIKPEEICTVLGPSGSGKSNFLALKRMYSEMKSKKEKIEQALVLRVTSTQAVEGLFKATVKAAMIPTLNLMKVVGLVQLPGAMTGMILAGASPLEAVKLQIIVVYMLICAGSLAAVITARLSQSTYFTKYRQLIVS